MTSARCRAMPNGTANGINASDWVVGEVDKSAATVRSTAFVWAPGGTMVDLNTRVKLPAGWVLEDANAINDAGQIVGAATVSGAFHAFLPHAVQRDPDLRRDAL